MEIHGTKTEVILYLKINGETQYFFLYIFLYRSLFFKNDFENQSNTLMHLCMYVRVRGACVWGLNSILLEIYNTNSAIIRVQ